MKNKHTSKLGIVVGIAAMAVLGIVGAAKPAQASLPPGAFCTPENCVYNGEEYSEGSVICMQGFNYKCEGGSWRMQSSGCALD